MCCNTAERPENAKLEMDRGSKDQRPLHIRVDVCSKNGHLRQLAAVVGCQGGVGPALGKVRIPHVNARRELMHLGGHIHNADGMSMFALRHNYKVRIRYHGGACQQDVGLSDVDLEVTHYAQAWYTSSYRRHEAPSHPLTSFAARCMHGSRSIVRRKGPK